MAKDAWLANVQKGAVVMIGICILIFFLGATVGMVLTVLATATSYDEAVDDAYQIGYEKGKEEGKTKQFDTL